MTKSIEKIIEKTKEKFGLDHYFLRNYTIEREVNLYNETVFKLSMEWLPKEYKNQDTDQLNPAGTAVITLDLPSERTQSLIFVHKETRATKNLLTGRKTEDIIHFIEEETGLDYERDFYLRSEEDSNYLFQACYKKIPLYPEGFIEVKLNEEGQLIYFSVHGQFLKGKTLAKEKFTLEKSKITKQIKKQVTLSQIPDTEAERFEKFYGIEEVFITNKEKRIIPYQVLAHDKPSLYLNKVISWEIPEQWTEDLQDFEPKPIDLNFDEVSYEQVLKEEASPNVALFNNLDEGKVIETCRDFLYKLDPFDSGMWTLKEVYIDQKQIHANLGFTGDEFDIEKIHLMIDPESYEVTNYLSNEEIIFTFMSFQEAEEEKITREEAYKLLKNLISLEPYYVYDRKQDKYILCGKIDSKYGLHAKNGQIVPFKE